MRTQLILLALLAGPAVAAAKDEAPIYSIEVDPRSVVSAIRERDGKAGRYVSLQFKILRVGETDREKATVTTVTKEEIRVDEDGLPVLELDLFQPRNQELSVVLAIDVSGSMLNGNKMDEAKKAALAFLERMDEKADVGLILFDHEIQVAEPPARHKEHRARLRELINGATPKGGTAYLDATVKAVDMLKKAKGRRAVVVMTDGMDTNSKTTLKEAITAAQSNELSVYTVGIGQPGKNEPVTTVLVLDRSGSMLKRADDGDKSTKIEALRAAATRFVALMRKGARTTLLPFSTEVDTPEPFTNDRETLRGRIQALNAFGGTLLYDATLAGVETLVAGNPPGRRAVVVLTDGKDEAPGSRHSDEAVVARAKEAGIPLYMLGLGAKEEINEPVMRRMAKDTGGDYYHAGTERKLLEVFENLSIQLHDEGIDEESLGALARETGGKYTHVSKLSDLAFIYEKLAEELQSTYKVTFASRRASHDGTARGIDVYVLRGGKRASVGGRADDVARGIVVPQMSYLVYLFFLVGLLGLLTVPGGIRRLYRAFGGAA